MVASAIILGFLFACNVPSPGMACPALSGAHRLGEGAQRNNEASVWGAMGRDPQAGESSIPGPVPHSHAHQVHRVMAWRVAGTGLSGWVGPDGGRIYQAEKRQGALLCHRLGSRSKI